MFEKFLTVFSEKTMFSKINVSIPILRGIFFVLKGFNQSLELQTLQPTEENFTLILCSRHAWDICFIQTHKILL